MLTGFPNDNILIEGAFEIFRASSRALIHFPPIIFLARILMIKGFLRPKVSYGFLLQDTLLFYIGLLCFEPLMELIIEIPTHAKDFIGSSQMPKLQTGDEKLYFLKVFSYKLAEVIDFVSVIIYWVITWLYLILISTMICIGSYILFFGTMFKLRWIISAFLVIVLTVSLWPFVWYVMDQMFVEIAKQLDTKGTVWGVLVSSVFAAGIKLGIPLASFYMAMKNPTALASSLKEGAGKMMKPLSTTSKVVKGGLAAVGVDTVAKSVVRPVTNTISSKTESAQARIKNAAPYLAYKANSGFSKLSRSDTSNNESKKTANYAQFKQEMVDKGAKVTKISAKNTAISNIKNTNTSRLTQNRNSHFKSHGKQTFNTNENFNSNKSNPIQRNSSTRNNKSSLNSKKTIETRPVEHRKYEVNNDSVG